MLRHLAISLAAVTSAAQAQTISGRVTDRTSGIPVAGVVVSALDAAGVPLVRTVTDSVSGYRMPLLAGAVKLNFRRIGFSPAQVAITDAVDGRIDVILTRLPTQLPPVKALASAQCDADANTGDALSMWEEARAGLLTSLVARESKTAFLSVLVYQTELVGDDEQPRTVQRLQMADVSHAFRSEDPAQLAKKGYFDGFAYIGPDENVLAEESFLATHCFRLGDAPNDSTIALRFTPAKGRKVVDLDGTLLLNRNPLDIRSIEYRYTRVSSAEEKGQPGGSILFRNMPNGITMVQQWRVRSASLQSRGFSTRMTVSRGSGAAARAPARGRSRDPVLSVTETGAIIELMQWPGAPAFMAPLATVSGVAVDKLAGKPLVNTPVRLSHTPFNATTDSSGAFTMIDVLPGIYQAGVGNPQLELFEAAADLVGPIAIKFGTNTGVTVTGDDAATTAARGCAEKKDGRVDMPKALAGTNAIFGMITSADGKVPPRGQQFIIEMTPAGAVPGTPAFPLKGKADQFGRFRACGLPAGTARIRASSKSGLSSTLDVALDPAHPYQLLTLKLPVSTGR
jgi:hypothetical protein